MIGRDEWPYDYDESCCDAEKRGGWGGGGQVTLAVGATQHGQDKANDTASSTFNTCLASTTLNTDTRCMKYANMNN